MHCQACGQTCQGRTIDGGRRDVCPDCGWIHWDNPIPAVGAVVRRGDEVLLCRRARPPHAGLWDVAGGFVERDESAEDGLRRELREELGLDATVGRLLGTWSGDYGGRPTLNLMFDVDVHGEPQAHDDVAEVRWWPLDALPELAWPHEAACLEGLADDQRSG